VADNNPDKKLQDTSGTPTGFSLVHWFNTLQDKEEHFAK
jgi:hypothetical protein